nr:putative glycosyl hydrolase [synthetic construct]
MSSMTSDTSSVKTGEKFTVNVTGHNVVDLYAYEINLTFDTELLNFVNAVSDNKGYTVSPQASGNKITFVLTKTKGQPPENGEVLLCTLTFTGKAVGASSVTLDSINLFDRILKPTNYSFVGKTVKVSIVTGSDTSPTPTSTPTFTPTPTSTPTPTASPAQGPTQMPTATREPSPINDGKATTISISVKPTIDPVTGKAAARVEASAMDTLVEKAKEAAGQKAVVEIKVEAAAGANAVEVEIPRDAFKKVADTTNAGVKVDTGIGTITFDSKAVDAINNPALEGDIRIGISEVDKSILSEEVQAKVGDRPVYDFSVKAGDTDISGFGDGKAEISIPYTLKAGEKRNAIVVYYVDNAGNLKTVRGRYDAATGTVKITVSHFSKYMIGYNEVSFSDVAADAWYNEAIGFMAARGIVNGEGNGGFAPANNVTRADFLVMVMNSYGIEPDTAITDNFADAGSKYYTRYLGTAKRLGVVFGVGGNKYAPDATLTREDMSVILYRVLDKLGELPAGISGKSLGSFSDAAEIAGYAYDAMKLFVETGIISGDGKNLNPKAASSKAEAAKELYNLLSRLASSVDKLAAALEHHHHHH